MAREQRKDVDYFPHDCTHGRKMHIIEANYGNDGYATWFKLLEQLGKANNHYIDISDEMTFLFLVANFKITRELTLSIFADLAKLGAIDKFLYEQHQIIWSHKFIESISDAYRKRKNPIFQYSDLLKEKGINNPQSGGRLTEETALTPEVIRKEEDSRVEERKEDKYISEIEFIKIWSNARMYYDKNKTGFDTLLPFEKQCFNQLKDNYTEEQFKHAVAGLFFQDTLPAVRVRPKHFLEPENFTKYLDCWVNQSKIFDNNKSETQVAQPKFQKGDV